MKRSSLANLAAFVAVAEEGSFTRAAARLGMSQSALSAAIKGLESELGLPLLARSTRSVAMTEAGQRLFGTARPALASIDAEAEALASLRHGLAGTVKVTAIRDAAANLLMPALSQLRARHPGIKVELVVDQAFTDIVAAGYDAGIRFGDHVEKDMVAIPIGGDVIPAVVGAPSYLAGSPSPHTPRELASHNCIGYRLARSRQLHRWQFADRGRPFEVSVGDSFVVNDPDIVIQAALDGQGLAYTFEHLVVDHLQAGRLVRVLEEWCAPMPGYYLYYPSRQKSPALAALIDALKTGRTMNAAYRRKTQVSDPFPGPSDCRDEG